MRVYCTHDLTACKECCYLVPTCLLPPHAQMKGGMGWSFIRGDPLHPHAIHMLNNIRKKAEDFLLTNNAQHIY